MQQQQFETMERQQQRTVESSSGTQQRGGLQAYTGSATPAHQTISPFPDEVRMCRVWDQNGSSW